MPSCKNYFLLLLGFVPWYLLNAFQPINHVSSRRQYGWSGNRCTFSFLFHQSLNFYDSVVGTSVGESWYIQIFMFKAHQVYQHISGTDCIDMAMNFVHQDGGMVARSAHITGCLSCLWRCILWQVAHRGEASAQLVENITIVFHINFFDLF